MKLWSCSGASPDTIMAVFDVFQREHPDAEIVSKHFTTTLVHGHGGEGDGFSLSCDTLYVFYEDSGDRAEELRKDQERLRQLCQRAKMLVDDEAYKCLKNQRERELYMLTKGFTGWDAADMIELLKPEMGGVLDWGCKDDGR